MIDHVSVPVRDLAADPDAVGTAVWAVARVPAIPTAVLPSVNPALLTTSRSMPPACRVATDSGCTIPSAGQKRSLRGSTSRTSAMIRAPAEPAAVPELAPVAEDGGGNGEISRTQSKREKRRQRRRARPHGRR